MDGCGGARVRREGRWCRTWIITVARVWKKVMEDMPFTVFNNVQCLSILRLRSIPWHCQVFLDNAFLCGYWNGSLKCPSFEVKIEFCIERWETTLF